MGSLKNKADYSQYKCPYSHLEKECGHELMGPEGYGNTYGVWCPCSFRGPVFYLDADELGLEKIGSDKSPPTERRCEVTEAEYEKQVLYGV